MLEEVIPLDPVGFFAFQIDCNYVKGKGLEKKHRLPDFSDFYQNRSFADVSIGWNEKGIYLQIEVKGSFDQPDFPNFATADSIELFFDTRDVKTTGYLTKFCHHFYFLPSPVRTNGDVIESGEITRLRGEDTRELCDGTQLVVKSEHSKKKCLVDIFIPAECLYGYDPAQFDRLGFTYRINRMNHDSQLFTASDADFPIQSQPTL